MRISSKGIICIPEELKDYNLAITCRNAYLFPDSMLKKAFPREEYSLGKKNREYSRAASVVVKLPNQRRIKISKLLETIDLPLPAEIKVLKTRDPNSVRIEVAR